MAATVSNQVDIAQAAVNNALTQGATEQHHPGIHSHLIAAKTQLSAVATLLQGERTA